MGDAGCARGTLSVDGALTGRFEPPAGTVDGGYVMREIDDARAEDAARRPRLRAAA